MTRPAESSMLTRNISGQSEKSSLEIIHLNQDRTGEAEWEIMIFTFFKGRLFDQIEDWDQLCVRRQIVPDPSLLHGRLEIRV